MLVHSLDIAGFIGDTPNCEVSTILFPFSSSESTDFQVLFQHTDCLLCLHERSVIGFGSVRSPTFSFHAISAEQRTLSSSTYGGLRNGK